MMEKGSGVPLLANPNTWASLLTAHAMLSNPPGSVPRSAISLPCQSTARTSGPPVIGSISPFCEYPATSPLPLIQLVELHWLPGSAPKLVSTPFCHLKAFGTKQSSWKQRGSAIEVSAVPVTVPRLLTTWSPAVSLISKKVVGTALLGPPKVPKSTSL